MYVRKVDPKLSNFHEWIFLEEMIREGVVQIVFPKIEGGQGHNIIADICS